ncbi:beta-lactamase family protein [Kribbella sandramycini]|uniref:Beta-lactamase family protein n=1 Tax=Kribbella sandramycini TaxID=60450 RepID=A0A7Y4P2G7_9ACTN|nr:CubicO group peptidase (beta-lactamase class C family) [Kribbella sandramycini]NOL44013.1 beta-lactamase family protein [Kribbella sandramycini]
MHTRLLAACTAVATLWTGLPAAQPEPASIAAVVERNLGPTRLPGVAVAVVKDGRVVHTGGYGRQANGEPVSSRTPMRIASLSKSFTALAVQQLAEAGRLRLDDPVVRRLPEFAMSDARAGRITIRQLLDHSSGMSDKSYPEAAVRQPESLQQAVAALRPVKLTSAPGEQHAYHNPNYWVAARVVEVVSGRPFADYLQQQVFHPLGMSSTQTVNDWGAAVPGLVDGHNRFLGFTQPRSEPHRFVAGSAGIVTTATDLAAWLALHTSKSASPVLSPAGLRELHRPSAPDGHYALGWDNPEPDQVAHNGSSFTSTATMVLLPNTGYGIALLSNSRMPLESDAEAIMSGLIALTEGAPAPDAPLPLAFLADAFALTGATLLAVGAVIAVRRASNWARRRRTWWTAALRTLPYLLPTPFLAFLPRILELVTGGRGVTFLLLSHLWPTFLAATGLTAIAGLVVATARVRALLQR